MSSPNGRSTLAVGNLFLDEKLSPIKLSSISERRVAELNEKENLKSVHTTEAKAINIPNDMSATIVGHPHGLQAKQEARRNTIHHLSKTPAKSLLIQGPLTSPRPVAPSLADQFEAVSDSPSYRIRSKRVSSGGTSDKEVYMQGIGKKPTRLVPDTSTHGPTSHLDFFISSSPSKRKSFIHISNEPPAKVAKVVTNGNEEKSIDAVIRKDSDPEESSDAAPSSIPRRRSLEDENTQQSHHDDNQDDYATPHRPTEAIAQSPQVNQLGRINEVVDHRLIHLDNVPGRTSDDDSKLISPLKGHLKNGVSHIDSDYANIEENLTISFLLSPNSKPVFSVNYVKKLQDRLYEEIDALEKAIDDKNLEILKFSEERTKSAGKYFHLDQKLNEHKLTINKLRANEELLEVQIKQSEIELASTMKKLKLKDSILYLTEAKLSNAQRQFDDTVDAIRIENRELRKELEEVKTELGETIVIVRTAEAEAIEHKNTIKRLRDENLSSNDKLLDLILERDSLVDELRETSEKRKELQTESNLLREEVDRKAKDLDEMNANFGELVKETTELHNEMAKIEHEHKVNEKKLSDKQILVEELSAKLEAVQAKSNNLEILLETNSAKLKDDSQLFSDLQRKNSGLQSELKRLNDQNNEKDRIISGDTMKLNELVEQVNKQKQIISDYKSLLNSENSSSLESRTENILLKQVANLKHQVATAQQKTDERIQEVAEQLYHQYSKKHELKVSQLKEKYEVKIQEKNSELEAKLSEIETLESQLRTEVKEKNYILTLLEKSEGDTRNKWSPKKTGHSRN